MPPMFQLTSDQKETVASGAKVSAAWGSVAVANSAAIANWAQAIASIAAAIYTVMLIIEFVWKKLGRPVCEARGWIKSKKDKTNGNDE